MADQLRDYLEARAYESVTMADASRELQYSVGHLTRGFKATFAVSPHAFVIGRRTERGPSAPPGRIPGN